MHAHILSGAVADYPYRLRATDGGDPQRCAKQLYPQVYPLPGAWELCSPEQLTALECVWVQDVERPDNAREGTPVLVDGHWQQNWIVQPAYDPATQTVRWDGAQWVVEAIPVVVPESVPAHHLRRALTQANMRAAVEMHISTLDEGDPMRDDWRYAPYFRRDAVGIEAARVALGLTVGQVDGLFVAAGQIIT